MRTRDPFEDRAPPMPLWNLARAQARRSDPGTSREAAIATEASGTARDQRARCLEAVRAHPGATAAEIARLTNLERHAPSRRLPELRDAGMVENGPPRICSVTGRSSVTWRPKHGPIIPPTVPPTPPLESPASHALGASSASGTVMVGSGQRSP